MIEIFDTKQSIFNLNDLSKLLNETNYNNLKSKISYYVKKGYINRIRRGIFVKKDFDKYELASKIYTPSYISFESVLLEKGVIYQYSDIIYVASYLTRYVEINFNNQLIKIQYRKLKDEKLLDNKGIVNKGFYNIATKNRAINDMKYLKPNFYFDKLPNGYKKAQNYVS